MSDVLIVGSCVQDLVSYTPRFPNPGESVRGSKFISGFGGKGANQAVAASRIGAKTAIVGRVGDDIFGPPTIVNFKNNGVSCDHVLVTPDASTATATITVSETGQNSIVVVLGANELLSVEDVGKVEEMMKASKVLCCQLEIKTEVTLEALKLARKHQVMTIFNPAPGLPNLDLELLKYSDVLCPNESEVRAEFLSGMSLGSLEDGRKIVKHLLTLGPKTVIITLGEKGCLYASLQSPEPKHVECPKVDARDTTGAGDSFVGSLAYFMAVHPSMALDEKIRRSSSIASISVQSLGTQASYPFKKDLNPDLFK